MSWREVRNKHGKKQSVGAGRHQGHVLIIEVGKYEYIFSVGKVWLFFCTRWIYKIIAPNKRWKRWTWLRRKLTFELRMSVLTKFSETRKKNPKKPKPQTTIQTRPSRNFSKLKKIYKTLSWRVLEILKVTARVDIQETDTHRKTGTRVQTFLQLF